MLALVLGVLGCGIVFSIGGLQHRWKRLRSVFRALLVSYGTLVLLLVLGEAYFRFIHADSEGALAKTNWIARYWQENSHGYRDSEWSADAWSGKVTVAAVGDSFTAGWGIANPADRFTDILAQSLGEGYRVFNLGLLGTSTVEQTDTVRMLPVAPDIIIWQYFLNDIEYTLLRLGLYEAPPSANPITQDSYLANYLYSRVTAGFDAHYWERRYAADDNPSVWRAHEQEIIEFVTSAQERGSRLILVIFPNMADPYRSIAYVDRVADAAASAGVEEVLKLFDAADAMPLNERIVSPRDAHPSVAFHHYVGERITHEFFLNAGQ
ncbi:MAG: SGNH/GDSL hydrolase family protein [Chloroflexi bacterium]|nr:SGNH/GDSL hydrolase family protein [Chloroflexota bacterium]